MFNMNTYVTKIAQTPNDYYRSLNQATIDSLWYNTTQIYNIQEENYPFDNIFTEHEVWVNSVSDVSTTTNKVIGNYIDIHFKQIEHPLNHRGQKYKYKTDGIIEDTYLCYDKLNSLNQVPSTKLILCNNQITWIDKENGAIYNEPMFVGWELTSTNNQTSTDGTVQQRRLVCLIQGNKNTSKIHPNQRFIIGHNKAFKVTQVNNTDLEHLDEEYPTLLTMYIEWSSILPTDNLELNIADYYDNNYTIEINQDNISQVNGFEGKLTVTTKYNDNIESIPVVWESENEDVVIIDNDGNYKLVGNSGDITIIKCYIEGNEDISDTINVEVITVPISNTQLIVIPNGEIDIFQNDTQEFNCGVYIDGVLQGDVVTCTTNWTNNKNYQLTNNGNKYTILNKKYSTNLLELTFSSGILEQVVIVNLRALF